MSSTVIKDFTKKHTNIAKGVAICLMLFYHLFGEKWWMEANGVDLGPISADSFLVASRFGNICVAIFALLSAYGISKLIFVPGNDKKADAGKVYADAMKRAVKLMLNFLILFLSVLAVFGWAFDYQGLYGSGKQAVLFGIIDALGLPTFFETPTICATWWYMGLAYMIIFIVPAMAMAARKIGYAILPIAFLVSKIVPIHSDLARYLFVVAFGVCMAYGSWPEKILGSKLHWALRWVIGLGCIVPLVLIRQNYVVQEHFIEIVDAPIAFFIVICSAGLIGMIPVIRTVFEFLGRNSMNIYLVHSFFYRMVYKDYIYYFHNPAIIFVILLAVTLLYSVILETIKWLVKKGIYFCKKKISDKKKQHD